MQANIDKNDTENSSAENSCVGTGSPRLKSVNQSQNKSLSNTSPARADLSSHLDTAPSASLGEASVQRQIVDGWYQGARYCVSPHFNARPLGEVSLLVIHNISLPAGCFGLPFIDHLFQGCLDVNADASFAPLAGLEVSAHFLVRRDGECVQYVSCDDRAWHAGVSRYVDKRIVEDDKTLTCEHAKDASVDSTSIDRAWVKRTSEKNLKRRSAGTLDDLTTHSAASSAEYSIKSDVQPCRIRENCNDFAIGIELEGTDTQAYTSAQYSKLAELTAALLAHYPLMDKSRIVGHCDIAPGRKTDPGDSFDWQRYLASV